MGIGGSARDARVRPYAALRFERTSVISEDGRRGVLRAFIRAWRFVPNENCVEDYIEVRRENT